MMVRQGAVLISLAIVGTNVACGSSGADGSSGGSQGSGGAVVQLSGGAPGAGASNGGMGTGGAAANSGAGGGAALGGAATSAGGSGGASAGGPNLPGGTKLTELDATQKATFCDWWASLLGGYGHVAQCLIGPRPFYEAQAQCVQFGLTYSCPLITVAQMTECVQAQVPSNGCDKPDEHCHWLDCK